MGGTTFSQVATGKTAKEAFDNATSEARYEYGHGGYTGSIAEKRDFIMLQPTPEKLAALKEAASPFGRYYGYDENDPLWEKVDDKWGPAGCIDLGEGNFIFFGWASS